MEEIRSARYERHRRREMERQRKIRNTIITILLAILMIIALGVAGRIECEDAASDLAEVNYWASQGVTISRW